MEDKPNQKGESSNEAEKRPNYRLTSLYQGRVPRSWSSNRKRPAYDICFDSGNEDQNWMTEGVMATLVLLLHTGGATFNISFLMSLTFVY